MNRLLPALLAVGLLPTLCLGQEVGGQIYLDQNGNATSAYVHQQHAPDHGMSNVAVTARSSRDRLETLTDARGGFAFSDLTSGTWLVTAEMEGACSSHNCPRRLPAAVDEGAINLVSFGDSIGKVGSDEPYPNRLRDHLQGVSEVSLNNISVSGSEANEWTPGTNYFDNRLAPLVADADVITFTLGGNDLTHYWYDVPWDITALTGFPEAYRAIKTDIIEISEAIYTINPDVDLVYVVYPPFANTEMWAGWFDYVWPIVRAGEWLMFADWRRAISDALPDILLADMLAATDKSEPIDHYMYDSIHPNDAGHQWYADIIFEVLGGVVIGDTPLGHSRQIAAAP